MAKRRMFSLDVVDTDKFLNMPPSTQCLYYNLGMRADDDGFVSSPQKIATISNCGRDDLNVLISKGYLIPFNSGVVVITDWKINNYIQKDRRIPTRYTEEMAQLTEENASYKPLYTECIQDVSNLYTDCIQNVSKVYTQDRIGKDNIYNNTCADEKQADDEKPVLTGENAPIKQPYTKCIQNVSKMYTQDRIDKDNIYNNIYTHEKNQEDENNNMTAAMNRPKESKHKYGEYKHVMLTDTEKDKLIEELGQQTFDKCVIRLDEYIEQTGKKYKNHNLVIRKWVIDAVKKDEQKDRGCTSATNRFNSFTQRESVSDDALESMLLDN